MVVMVYGVTQQCFTGDTIVATENGLRLIEDIEVGDYVWSEDVETGEQTLNKVLAVYVSQADMLVQVELSSGEVINTTEGHPFYTEEKGWCVASELEAGDCLRTLNGDVQTVVSVTIEKLNEPVKVYNLEIQGGHTYYVTSDVVLVHNKCGTDSDELKEIYDSIKKAPNYPNGFQARPNGTTSNKVNNMQLLDKLRQIEAGIWKKVYKDGYDSLGNKISIHFFQSQSGKVFDVKVKKGWSN